MKPVIWIGLLAAGLLAPEVRAEVPRCSGPLARPFGETPGRPGFRLLITRYTGAEPVAGEVGPSLKEELDKYMKRELGKPAAQAADLRVEDVQVRYAECLVRDHEGARRYGQEVGADVVFFGQALAEDRKEVARRARGAVRVEPKVKGDVTISGQKSALVKVEVKVAGGRGSFKTYVTVVRAPRLETSGGGLWIRGCCG
jgi:hypothetical protein